MLFSAKALRFNDIGRFHAVKPVLKFAKPQGGLAEQCTKDSN